MKLGLLQSSYPDMPENTVAHTLSWTGLEEWGSREKNSKEKEELLKNLSSESSPYLISLSSYNKLLNATNKSPIVLAGDEVAMYSNEEFSFSHDILRKALKSNPTVSIDKRQYKLTSTLYTRNLVADRATTISYGLIVPDDMFNSLIGNSEESYWNMVLDSHFVHKKGLMEAMYQVEESLNTFDVHYESYLSSMEDSCFI